MTPMTTEERIAELEKWATANIQADDADVQGMLVAIAYELRALRLMLRDEIREAAWPLKQWAELNYAPIVPRPESMRKASEIEHHEQPPSVFESDMTGGGEMPPKVYESDEQHRW